MNTVTERDLALRRDPYWTGRWSYIDPVCSWLRAQPSHWQVLEIGPYTMPLVPGSWVLDRKDHAGMAPLFKRTLHDVRQAPWPLPAAMTFDLGIALQVWEHLEGAQEAAFAELRRVARRAILSTPYKWPRSKSPGHTGIDLARITGWAGGQAPAWYRLVKTPGQPGFPRIICYWDFAEAKENAHAA